MFITLEGIEGSGKSTLIDALANHLRDIEEVPLISREPGGSGLGRKLRPILLSSATDNLAKEAELFLFLADRAQHVHELIKPALKEGQIILCDRYTDSTLAYQGYGRGLNLEALEKMCKLASLDLVPDLTILLDLPVRMGLGRALQRNYEQGRDMNESRFDTEALDFHERVRAGYLKLAEMNPERIKIVNAANGLEQVIQDCIQVLDSNMMGDGNERNL